MRRQDRQRGAILLVSMIILLVMTLLGVAAMESAGVEMKMATNSNDRQQAFLGAESALRLVEAEIEADTFKFTQFYNSCSGSDCFESTCTGGYCFNGDYASTDDRHECINEPVYPSVWEEEALWGNSARYQTIDVEGLDSDPKYIIEFMCFVNREITSGAVFDKTNPDNGAPFFRITVLAESNSGRGRVMLQSTYKWLD